MRTLSELFTRYPGCAERGLASETVAQSRQEFGRNALTPLPREPLWKKFVEKFDEPIIKILLAAALLSMFVEFFNGHPGFAFAVLLLILGSLAGLHFRNLGQWIPTGMFVSAIVTFILCKAIAGHVAIDGLAVMIAVILATGVAFLSEYKSDREFEALNARKDEIQVKVTRNGEFHTVLLEELVVGDLVSLEMGDEIPADGRLLKATDLFVDQSLMTGESEPVKKHIGKPDEVEAGPERADCVYRGTQVVDGVGQMLVTDVGDATYLGQIARKLSGEGEEDEGAEGPETEEKRVKRKLTISKELTPLQVKLTQLAEMISKVGYIAAVAIFLALLIIRGLIGGQVLPEADKSFGDNFLKIAGSLLNYFVYMVIIIVVAVPEGLPMSVTVSLALAMRKMTRANSLVRQLVACETIGSATVICSDKTGTLTQNKMQVVRLFAGDAAMDRGTPAWALPEKDPAWPRNGKPLDWLVINAAINSTANLEEKEGKIITVGNSTEGSLLQWLREAGLDYEKLRDQFKPLYQIHFSSERKRMTTVIRYGDKAVTLVKGAPEWVLAQCTHYQGAEGTLHPWTTEARARVEDWIKDSASQAMRTLAFAYAVLPPDVPTDEDALHSRRESLENNLVFAGLVAIRDPLRDDVKEAVERCRSAGIEVKMITGDNVETARAIAYDIGLVDRRDAPIDSPAGVIFTSPKFNELYEQWRTLRTQENLPLEQEQQREELRSELCGLRVLARAKPLDKYKMVEVLQSRDEVVAMTGDGTNDAPSLKKADVGLAMGIAGTEVAKEASKIVLLDDAFSTIVKAVQWGRSLYENIQRFIQFQLTINVSALTIAFLGPFFGLEPPFTVLQLLWINIIMDTFASIALCSEPPRDSVMLARPKRKDENIVTPAMFKTIMITASFFVVVMMSLLAAMKWGRWFDPTGGTPGSPLSPYQAGVFFTMYVFFQIWNQINCRSLVPSESGLTGLFSNPIFLAIVGAIAVVQILITEFEPLADIFKIATLHLGDWVLIIVVTSSVLIFAEVARRLRLKLAAQNVPTTPAG